MEEEIWGMLVDLNVTVKENEIVRVYKAYLQSRSPSQASWESN